MDISSELAQGQSKCVQIIQPNSYNYNVVNERTRKTHNKYRPHCHPRSVHGLWENQRGVSNVFSTYSYYFIGGSIQTWGFEAPGELNPLAPTPPPTNRSTAYAIEPHTAEGLEYSLMI